MQQLVQNGVWQVPVDERPMGVLESSQKRIVVTRELDILRCDCGRAIQHTGRCCFRVLRYRQKPLNRAIAKFQSELAPAVKKGAEWFGADGYLISTALVMLAGMYTRDIGVLARFTGMAPILVSEIALKLEAAGIFKPDGVLLGPMDTKDGDIEFWLIAMAGAGRIKLIENKDGSLMFDAIRNKRQANTPTGR